MKTIEEELSESYKKAGENACYGNGFKAGIELAQRWIAIEEELPDSNIYDNVLVKLLKTDYRYGRNEKYESIYIASVNCYSQFIINLMNNEEAKLITHWRPIERF